MIIHLSPSMSLASGSQASAASPSITSVSFRSIPSKNVVFLVNRSSHSRICPVNGVCRGTREILTTSNPSEIRSCFLTVSASARKRQAWEKPIPLSRILPMGNTKDLSRRGHNPSCATQNVRQSAHLHIVRCDHKTADALSYRYSYPTRRTLRRTSRPALKPSWRCE